MDEVVQETAELEVAPPEAINHDSEKHSETNVNQEQETVQEKNWKAMRQREEALEKRLKEKEEMLERFMTMQLQQNTQKAPVYEEPEEPDEDFIPKGKVKSLAKKATEPLEARLKELEARLEQRQQQDSLNQLKTRYSDFDQIVNPDSLALLEEQEPELARAMVASGDPLKMGTAVYKYLKAINNPAMVEAKKHTKEIDKKIAKNEKTIQSPLAYDKRPMAQAFNVEASKEERQKLWEEMNGFANQASSVPYMN